MGLVEHEELQAREPWPLPGWQDLGDSSVRGGNVGNRSKHDHSCWEAVVLAARERAHSRQAFMVERYGLSGDVQYDWSMDDAQITWSRDGKVFLTGRLTVIGSVSLAQQTWLWSWANESIPDPALGGMERVRQYGEENDYPVLPWPGFKSDPELVAEARMVAASVLDAEGLWAESVDGVQLHFMVHDLALADERP
ncbi:DUF6882 domain-containing protein [Streptomyces sp. NPDC090132]|uniref:DUF6882 domain-containing protein n=1 Tax=Streptomyces sp. NPDC090132 TaxID=3365955 RepID=UPI0038204694